MCDSTSHRIAIKTHKTVVMHPNGRTSCTGTARYSMVELF